jgi:hypothetical protein
MQRTTKTNSTRLIPSQCRAAQRGKGGGGAARQGGRRSGGRTARRGGGGTEGKGVAHGLVARMRFIRNPSGPGQRPIGLNF